jgi:hypothetical protein
MSVPRGGRRTSHRRSHSLIARITRHGLQAANMASGMSRVTTLPAPITDWLGVVIVH